MCIRWISKRLYNTIKSRINLNVHFPFTLTVSNIAQDTSHHFNISRPEFSKHLTRTRHRRSSQYDVKRKRANSKLKSSFFFCFFFCDCAKRTESNCKCGKCETNQQLEMDPMREETEFLLLRRTGELTPPLSPAHRQSDRRSCRL